MKKKTTNPFNDTCRCGHTLQRHQHQTAKKMCAVARCQCRAFRQQSLGSALAAARWKKPNARQRDSERMKAVWAKRKKQAAEAAELLAYFVGHDPCKCAYALAPKCPHVRGRRWLEQWAETIKARTK